MAFQSLPLVFCLACHGHDLQLHDDVIQCHDCGHIIEQQPQPEVK